MLAVTALALVRLHDLFAITMLSGIYSLVSAVLFVVLDAVDVAFTEASVGAGVVTVFLLSTLALTASQEKPMPHKSLLALGVVVITGAALIYGTLDIPPVGDPNDPIHHHVTPRYIYDSPQEIGVPNMVTSILASYRGYDTLGETVVIFTAGLGVLLLIGGKRRRSSSRDKHE